jgi:hypothetical protein
MRQSSYDFGQLKSAYRAYGVAGDCFAEVELLNDSEALAWGNYINESRQEEFYMIAHRRTIGMEDAEIGRWGFSEIYDVNSKTKRITPHSGTP